MQGRCLGRKRSLHAQDRRILLILHLDEARGASGSHLVHGYHKRRYRPHIRAPARLAACGHTHRLWPYPARYGCPGVGNSISGTSKQVKIFSTPLTFNASFKSKETTFPFAMVLRTTLATNAPFGSKSAVYFAAPRNLVVRVHTFDALPDTHEGFPPLRPPDGLLFIE